MAATTGAAAAAVSHALNLSLCICMRFCCPFKYSRYETAKDSSTLRMPFLWQQHTDNISSVTFGHWSTGKSNLGANMSTPLKPMGDFSLLGIPIAPLQAAAW